MGNGTVQRLLFKNNISDCDTVIVLQCYLFTRHLIILEVTEICYHGQITW